MPLRAFFVLELHLSTREVEQLAILGRNALAGIFCFGTLTENSEITLQRWGKTLTFFPSFLCYAVKVPVFAYTPSQEGPKKALFRGVYAFYTPKGAGCQMVFGGCSKNHFPCLLHRSVWARDHREERDHAGSGFVAACIISLFLGVRGLVRPVRMGTGPIFEQPPWSSGVSENSFPIGRNGHGTAGKKEIM